MLKIGQHQTLEIMRFTSVGAFLSDETGDEVLLPKKYLTKDMAVNDRIKVFVYKDSEDRPVATTETPLAYPGDFAVLEVTDVTHVGAFVNIGLEKDVLIPYREQNNNLTRGQRVLVYVDLDQQTDRLYASCKVGRFIKREAPELKEGMMVDILVGYKTNLGWNAIIENKYMGLIYGNEVYRTIHTGDQITAYIKRMREDNKIDLSLQPHGHEHREGFEETILKALEDNGGVLPIGDKSPPEVIYAKLGMSKKNFKKAVGGLYKQRVVQILPHELKKIT